MTTKIKGAIEVEVRFKEDKPFTKNYVVPDAISFKSLEEKSFDKVIFGIWLSHTDLEAYVQERERKLIAVTIKHLIPAESQSCKAARQKFIEKSTSEIIEDFKKEQGE